MICVDISCALSTKSELMYLFLKTTVPKKKNTCFSCFKLLNTNTWCDSSLSFQVTKLRGKKNLLSEIPLYHKNQSPGPLIPQRPQNLGSCWWIISAASKFSIVFYLTCYGRITLFPFSPFFSLRTKYVNELQNWLVMR